MFGNGQIYNKTEVTSRENLNSLALITKKNFDESKHAKEQKKKKKHKKI